ncbi:FUSC family protein [Candidatus Binatia bacterium]|nr:FUSC family protein [Candidatus Binatia bacterium]
MTILGSQTFAADRRAPSVERRESLTARLWAFLRAELAPSPARWRTTARIVIACIVATALAMSLRIPNAHWLIVTIFIVSQPNVGATLDKAVLRLAGTIVGALGVIVTVIAFPQQPWFQLPLIALLIGSSAFLSRTTSYPYVAMLGGLTIVLFLGSSEVHPTTSVDDGLWRLAAIALAEVIATAAHLVLWPDDPEDLLLKDVERILTLVEERLERLLRGVHEADGDAGRARIADGVFNGLVRHLDLLSNAETRYRSLRGRHSEQLVLIGATNRVATASLTLESLLEHMSGRLPAADAGDPLSARITALVHAMGRLRRALAERRPAGAQDVAALAGPAPLVGRDLTFLPSLLDMERALTEIPAATAFLDRATRAPRGDLAPSPLEGGATSFFTPACTWSNTRDLRFAAQVSLASMLCYLLVAGLDWPGLSTAVVTCVVVAQSSFGATVQKALLRIAGAIVGGVLGIGSILLVIPYIDSLPPFLLVIGACSAVAAYVVAGSARISYVGIQIALAFALTLLDAMGPSIDLVKPRDRVLGILVGNVVTAAVTFWLWPVLAGAEMQKSLVSALRHLAALSGFGIEDGGGERSARPARGYRLQIHQDLAATLRLHAEAQFEPGAATPEHRTRQQRLLDLQHEVQQVFLLIAGLVRNRLNVGLGRIELPSHAALRAVALAVGPNLEAAATGLEGRRTHAVPDLDERIAAADAALAVDAASAIELPGASAAVTEMRSQLELYRTLAPLLARLEDDARDVGSAGGEGRSPSGASAG